MLRKTLLIGTCLVTMTGAVSAASVKPEASAQSSVQVGAKQASENDDMLRASKFIGETVRNGKGEKIGSVDDLILNRGDKVLYAVLSVGGFLGIGDRLVAVPFEELKFGTKDVDGVVIYDTTKEQLEAQPAFTYASDGEGMTQERFTKSAERRVDLWQDRIDQGMKDAKKNASKMKEGASARVDSAWEKVKVEWVNLKDASAETWQSAKKKFDAAMTDLEKAWGDATS
jgi:sporulation protein YlmC with PRC-barrel domain